MNLHANKFRGKKGKMGENKRRAPFQECDSAMLMKIQISWNDMQGGVRSS